MLRIPSNNRKLLFLSLFFTFITFLGYSQNKAFWDNVHYGGSLGLGFGSNTFNLSVSPSAIYQVNEQLAFGIGINYNYYKFQNFKLQAGGASLLTLFNPIRPIQISAEFEQLRVNRKYEFFNGNDSETYWSPALFLGMGYSNQNVTIGLKYDVLYDESKSIYADALIPFVRVYF
ncbi:MAG: alpha-ketoglutarate decarboxylase [Flavobacteriaceae bacterium]|nr:MAG: alpha-ketoglutarate decarboxylase [Flavobacteriaceae bacterium]